MNHALPDGNMEYSAILPMCIQMQPTGSLSEPEMTTSKLCFHMHRHTALLPRGTVLAHTQLCHALPQVGIPHTNQEAKLGKTLPRVCEEVERRQSQGKIREGEVSGPAVIFQVLAALKERATFSGLVAPCEGEKETLT